MEDFNQDYQEKEEVKTSELDDALLAVREAEEAYDEAHKISAAKHATLQSMKGVLIDMMDRAGKTRWECKGVKGFSMKESLVYRFTKDINNKKKFFDFLGSQKVADLLKQNPDDVFLSYATIHAGSFKTLASKLVEEAAERGEQLELPGIDAPTTEKTLISLRKTK